MGDGVIDVSVLMDKEAFREQSFIGFLQRGVIPRQEFGQPDFMRTPVAAFHLPHQLLKVMLAKPILLGLFLAKEFILERRASSSSGVPDRVLIPFRRTMSGHRMSS